MIKQYVTHLAALGVALLCANPAFASPFIISVAVGPQSPAALQAGSNAVYLVSLVKTNHGHIDADLTISNLPPGATASFSPTSVVFFGNSPSTLTSTLTVSTTNSVADGTYRFSVTSTDASRGKTCAGTGTLIVGSGHAPQAQTPSIVSISLLADKTPQIVVSGTPGVPYQLQATASLGAPSWTAVVTNVTAANGMFTFADLNFTNYLNRFYRAAKVQ